MDSRRVIQKHFGGKEVMTDILGEIKATLKTIAEEDSRDADLVTDGTGDILRGRAELAEDLLGQMTKKRTLTGLNAQRNQWREFGFKDGMKELTLAENLTDFAKDRIAEYVKMVQLKINEDWQSGGFTFAPPPRVFTQTGKRYVRIVKEEKYLTNYFHRPTYVHTFIDLTNGDILKVGTEKRPARNGTRGNLCSSDIGASVVDWHGAKHLR
jgi:hypothetical protein